MSALLGLNQQPYYSWKDQTIYQVSSFITKNNNNVKTLGIQQLMKPMPLKIYRREIASIVPGYGCSNRISQSIDLFNMPGSTIVAETNACMNGLVNYINNPVTECKSQSCNINMPDIDAKRRVRSAGMIRKTYNPAQNNSTYCTDRNQYLVSRNKTFSQNQYNFIRQGRAQVKPGSSIASNNTYSPNGISHCQQPYISVNNNNNTFTYTWLDNKTYTVTLPEGQYDINELNKAFQNSMTENNTFFIQNETSYLFLFNFEYDNMNNVITLQVLPFTNYLTNTGGNRYTLKINYTVANITSWISGGVITVTNSTISVIIPSSNFQHIIGFTSGAYNAPSQSSNIQPHITSNYVKMNYKPNNSQFAVQGAVSGSNFILRKKYNTITDVASRLQSAYGSATANALAYGVSSQQYTLKSQIGFPIKKTPVICKYTGDVGCMDPPVRQRFI